MATPSGFERFLERFGQGAFIAYAVVAVGPIFGFQTEFNAPFVYAFKVLGVPIYLLCLGLYLFAMPAARGKLGAVKGALIALPVAAMLTVLAGGYVTLLNGVGPGQSETVVHGRIVEMRVSSGRRSTHYLVTVIDADGRRRKLDVPRHEYERLAIGRDYSQRWKVGTLGLLYR